MSVKKKFRGLRFADAPIKNAPRAGRKKREQQKNDGNDTEKKRRKDKTRSHVRGKSKGVYDY